MGKWYIVSVSLILCNISFNLGIESAYGGITIEGIKCGQKTCKLSEYCSNFDLTCQSCADVCNRSHHNYDLSLCEKQCQDYLHDLRYIKKGEGNEEDLRATVQQLSRMVTITLTLVCFMLCVLACLLCFQLYRWKVKKHITFDVIRNKIFKRKTDGNASNINPPSTQDNKKRDLRLEMPSPTVNSDHSPVTVSTSISRRPAEDSTLDYAYDNPAMVKTNNSSF